MLKNDFGTGLVASSDECDSRDCCDNADRGNLSLTLLVDAVVVVVDVVGVDTTEIPDILFDVLTCDSGLRFRCSESGGFIGVGVLTSRWFSKA